MRNIRDPDRERTQRAHEHTRPCISWCKFCVMGLGVGSRHKRSDAEDDLEGVFHVSMGCGLLGEKESEEQVTPVLVIRERRHTMTWAMLVPRKGTDFPWIAKRAAKFIGQLGHKRAALICDNEPAIEAVAREVAQAREVGSWTVPERDHLWERASPTESANARWDSWLVRP